MTRTPLTKAERDSILADCFATGNYVHAIKRMCADLDAAEIESNKSITALRYTEQMLLDARAQRDRAESERDSERNLRVEAEAAATRAEAESATFSRRLAEALVRNDEDDLGCDRARMEEMRDERDALKAQEGEWADQIAAALNSTADKTGRTPSMIAGRVQREREELEATKAKLAAVEDERDKALADVAKYADRSESLASSIDHLVSNTADSTDLARIAKERDDFRDGMVAMLVAAGAPADLDGMEEAVSKAGDKPSDFVKQRIRVLTEERDALWTAHRDVVDERDALKAKLADPRRVVIHETEVVATKEALANHSEAPKSSMGDDDGN